MTDKEQIIIDTNKYFVEIIDESKSTIGYTVVFPEKLLTEIMKQNKQLARKTQECERMKYYLNKIRDEELQSLDIEWDEYITECDTTDYSNIITYAEYALGEKEDD